jgi:hypothetical protein
MESVHLSVPADKKLDAQRQAARGGVSVSALFVAAVRFLNVDQHIELSDARKLFWEMAREEQARADAASKTGGR